MFTLDDHERSSTHEQLREIHDDAGRFDEEVGRDHVEFLRSMGTKKGEGNTVQYMLMVIS